MVRYPLLALVLCAGLAPAHADGPQLVLDTSLSWARDVGFAAHVSDGTFGSFLQWHDSLEDLSRGVTAFGARLPWILVGPLAPAGLFREAANPFGFAPASRVFSERTGFQLDDSGSPGGLGMVCMPVPDVLGLYCRLLRGGLPEYGFFASLLAETGFGAEGLLCFSSPPPGAFGEDWFRPAGPFPGGSLLISAGRCMIVLPGLAMEAGASASFGERVEPGLAWHVQASARGPRAQAALVFSRAEGAAVEPGGGMPVAECQFGFSAGVASAQGSAKLGYTITVDRPGFVPGRFRRTAEKLTLALEQSLLHAAGLQLVARADAEKRVERDECGAREEDTGSRWSLAGRARAFEAAAGMAVEEGEGIGVFLSGFLPRAGAFPRVSLAVRLDRLDGGRPELSASGSVRLEWDGCSLSLEPGIDRMPLVANGSGGADRITMKAVLSFHTTPAP
jgi:hypothetical protein